MANIENKIKKILSEELNNLDRSLLEKTEFNNYYVVKMMSKTLRTLTMLVDKLEQYKVLPKQYERRLQEISSQVDEAWDIIAKEEQRNK